MYRLFIVEDDPGIANAVAAQAQAWNLQTHIVRDFSNVMHEFAEFFAAYSPARYHAAVL